MEDEADGVPRVRVEALGQKHMDRRLEAESSTKKKQPPAPEEESTNADKAVRSKQG